ncbi:MAG: hypothetical protein QOK31_1295, partial [Solirubrobacteraceae bacterium]|nr:hypothetical protein [Solirubrobacteraceae bacterium]
MNPPPPPPPGIEGELALPLPGLRGQSEL